MSGTVSVAGCQHCMAPTNCGLDFLCRISEPYAAVGRHMYSYCGADLPFRRRVQWECVLASLVGGIPLASVHRGLTALRMALISGGALSLLAGSAQPADAAAGMRFY